MPGVVLIEERDQLTVGLPDGVVPSRRLPGPALSENPDRERSDKTVKEVEAVVRGAIVDDDEFLRELGLADHTLDCLAQVE
jgi:hypothetical protein